MAENKSVLTELTFDQLQQVIAASVAAAVSEFKKPDPEVAAKAAEEKRRKEQTRAEMIASVNAEREATAQRQASCTHIKENGRTCVSGQVFSDGMFHGFCVRCQKEWISPAPSSIAGATGIGNVGAPASEAALE